MIRPTAANNAVRQLASACGTALLATVLSDRLARHEAIFGVPATRIGAVAAFHDTFVAASLLALLAFGAAALISDRLAARTMDLALESGAESAALTSLAGGVWPDPAGPAPGRTCLPRRPCPINVVTKPARGC